MTLKLATSIEVEVESGLSDQTLIYKLWPLICKTHNPKTQIWSLTTPVVYVPICRGFEGLVARDTHDSNYCMVAYVKGRN
jgi:hypothetical protein